MPNGRGGRKQRDDEPRKKPAKPKIPEQVEFTVTFDNDYRVVACNGVWGGLTTRNDIKLDFFVESPALPERVTYKVREGQVTEEIGRQPRAHLEREMQIGVLLPLSQLHPLINWLQERLEEINRLSGGLK